MAELDFSFVTWQFVQDYLLKGLYFTLFLTSVATIGGIFFGTILALMRLSGTKFLEYQPPSTSMACAPFPW